jgi:hypothetical protein
VSLTTWTVRLLKSDSTLRHLVFPLLTRTSWSLNGGLSAFFIYIFFCQRWFFCFLREQRLTNLVSVSYGPLLIILSVSASTIGVCLEVVHT